MRQRSSLYTSPSFRQGFATRSDGSRQAVLPDAVRVNANLFQTALCLNPDYMEVFKLAIPFDYTQDRPRHYRGREEPFQAPPLTSEGFFPVPTRQRGNPVCDALASRDASASVLCSHAGAWKPDVQFEKPTLVRAYSPSEPCVRFSSR